MRSIVRIIRRSCLTGLVTVAQALHWFDFAAFFAEAKRVLSADGMIAIWCYNLFRVTPEIDVLVENFYAKRLGIIGISNVAPRFAPRSESRGL